MGIPVRAIKGANKEIFPAPGFARHAWRNPLTTHGLAPPRALIRAQKRRRIGFFHYVFIDNCAGVVLISQHVKGSRLATKFYVSAFFNHNVA